MHPARQIPVETLWQGLQAALAERLVTESVGHDGLRLYCYSQSCVYDRRWNEVTLLARGLILDPANRRIVATPFPKFFNMGEGIASLPDLPFETFEKLDGSLIILFHHNGEWRTATKGSLVSDQAKWAADWVRNYDLATLDRGATYLCEAIYPENRIVVRYDHVGLVLLGAYESDGAEVGYADLCGIGDQLGWQVARRHAFASVSELFSLARALPPTQEGFVLRFSNGLRVKVKGEEYCRIHRLILRVTPLALWEAMQAEDDLESIRRQLPEEFWTDFDAIVAALRQRIDELIATVKAEAEKVAALSDKDVGLMLDRFEPRVLRLIFPYRKNQGDILTGRARDTVFREIRPVANRLEGYTPSRAVNRVLEELVTG